MSEQKVSIHLKGVGRFCQANCGRRLEGKLVTKLVNGKEKTYFRPAPKNMLFCSKSCKNREGIKKWKMGQPKTMHATIKLKVMYDKNPYRELVIYLNNSAKESFKVTPDYKDLWNFLEKISKFRDIKNIPEMRLLESVILER